MEAVNNLICANCGKPFTRRTASVNEDLKRRSQTNHYCSRTCSGLAQRRRLAIRAICQQCQQPFTRTSHGRRERAMFCSRRCAAIYRSRNRNRKGAGTCCPKCGGRKSRNGSMCRSCRAKEFNSRLLGKLRAHLGTFAFHAKVRGLARSAYSGPRVCAACGYSLHVDICHIRDVASFPNSATLAEVNAPSNLVALDKRCHWEFDHGYLVFIDGRFVSSWRVSDSNGSSGL
jgi:hypothetical protein